MLSKKELKDRVRQSKAYMEICRLLSWSSLMFSVLATFLMYMVDGGWGIVAISSAVCTTAFQFASYHFERCVLLNEKRLHVHDPTDKHNLR